MVGLGPELSFDDLFILGAETVSHIRENGRVTILFHAFEGPARIVRLYGKGSLISHYIVLEVNSTSKVKSPNAFIYVKLVIQFK